MGKIRIIGGKWKGRKIFVPITSNKITVRPTMNRIREILFNWLTPMISGAVCLDCFAGSGVLGLEALSRGARYVTFVERNFFCISALREIIRLLQVNSINVSEVIYANSFNWLRKFRKKYYDIVFLDPPFQKNEIHRLIYLLEKYKYLKKKSWIYIETGIERKFDDSCFPNYWSLYRIKRTQTVVCYLYLRDVCMV